MISLLRGTTIVAGLTLVSRVLGFIRDLLVASLLGAGAYSDAYLVAFRIPNMLRSLFAEGALTSAFVPTFSHAVEQGPSQARLAFRSVAKFLVLATGLVTVCGVIFAPFVIDVVAPGFVSSSSVGHAEQAALLLRLMFPYIVAVSLVALINGALNSVGVFGASAFAQIVMNLCLIGGALIATLFWGAPETSLKVLAISVVIGGIVQVAVQVPALRRAGLWGGANEVAGEDRDLERVSGSARGDDGIWSPAVKNTVRLMGPAVLGSAVYQMSVFLMTALSSLVSAGAVSWLFYADRLIQLPIGVFSVALSSVLLPALARAHARDDQDQFEGKLNASLRFSTFLIVPVSLIIWEHATTLVWLLFERGEFLRRDTLATAQVISAMALGIWITTCQSLLSRAFISRKDTVTPTVAGTVSLVGTLLFAVMLMGPVGAARVGLAQSDLAQSDLAQSVGPRDISPDMSREILPEADAGAGGWIVDLIQWLQSWLPCVDFGAAGLALGNTLALMLGAVLLLIMLPMRVTGLSWRGFIRCGVQCWLMGAVAIWSARMVVQATFIIGGTTSSVVFEPSMHSSMQPSMQPSLEGLILGVVVFAGVYMLGLLATRNQVLHDIWSVLYRFYKRRGSA